MYKSAFVASWAILTAVFMCKQSIMQNAYIIDTSITRRTGVLVPGDYEPEPDEDEWPTASFRHRDYRLIWAVFGQICCGSQLFFCIFKVEILKSQCPSTFTIESRHREYLSECVECHTFSKVSALVRVRHWPLMQRTFENFWVQIWNFGYKHTCSLVQCFHNIYI